MVVIIDTPSYTGCLVQARLIGVLEAEQSEVNGKTERNDRFVAVAIESQDYKNLQSLQDLGTTVLDQLEHFFYLLYRDAGKTLQTGATQWLQAGPCIDPGWNSRLRGSNRGPIRLIGLSG